MFLRMSRTGKPVVKSHGFSITVIMGEKDQANLYGQD
jgi:hypothetical protein